VLTVEAVSAPATTELPSTTVHPVQPAPRPDVFGRFATLTVLAAVALLPVLRPSGPGNSAPVDVVIVVVIGATLLSVIASRSPIRLPYAVPVGVLVVAGAVGALLHEPTSAAVTALGQDVLVFLFAAAIVNACRTPDEIGAVLRTWSITATIWAWVMIVAVVIGDNGLAGITARTGTRASLTFGDANLAASYFVISFLMVVASQTPRRRVLRCIAYVVLGTAVLLTGSLGGMLTLGLALGVLTVCSVARRFGGMAAVAIMLLVAPLVFVGVRAAYDSVTSAAQDPNSAFHDSFGRVSSSSASRDQILSEDVKLLGRASPLGEGPTSTKAALEREQVIYVKEAHNDYLATAIERGVLGVLGLVLLAGALVMRSRQALARGHEPAMARAVPRVPALIAALLTVACSAMFYEVLHFRHVWVLFGIVAAIALAREP
jgi:O-antigen ligase